MQACIVTVNLGENHLKKLPMIIAALGLGLLGLVIIIYGYFLWLQ